MSDATRQNLADAVAAHVADEISSDSLPGAWVLRAELAGHDLMCWCQLVDAEGKRVPCLADVLLCVANRWDRS